MATEIPGGDQSREMQEAVAKARNGLRDAYERGADRAAQLKDAAMGRASQFKDAAFDRGRVAISSIQRTVDERPFLVIGGVFLGGIVLGFLLRRSRD